MYNIHTLSSHGQTYMSTWRNVTALLRLWKCRLWLIKCWLMCWQRCSFKSRGLNVVIASQKEHLTQHLDGMNTYLPKQWIHVHTLWQHEKHTSWNLYTTNMNVCAPPKTENCHDANFAVTGGTGDCCDNFRCLHARTTKLVLCQRLIYSDWDQDRKTNWKSDWILKPKH